MQFIDLAAQQKLIRDKIEANIKKVLDHGQYVMGPEIGELEQRLGEYVGVKHAVACSSGTDALLLALMADDVGPGDAVFTSPFTFIATAEVISLLGATPVFVDIDPETYNIDPYQLDMAINSLKSGSGEHPMPGNVDLSSLTPKGIIPVDLFGLPADYGRINRIGRGNGLFVIEDAAQSFGGKYKSQMACSLGDIGCTSFFPAKPLGCYGDGGMCFTDSDELAEKMRSLCIHGQNQDDKYENVRIGINGRFDTLQAAILLSKFEIFPGEVEKRQDVAIKYNKFISHQAPDLVTPEIFPDIISAWAQYSILAQDSNHRSMLQEKLKQKSIPSAVYYSKPLHLQTAFKDLGYKAGDFPVCENRSKRIFSLPMHPYLSDKDQDKIVKALC